MKTTIETRVIKVIMFILAAVIVSGFIAAAIGFIHAAVTKQPLDL